MIFIRTFCFFTQLAERSRSQLSRRENKDWKLIISQHQKACFGTLNQLSRRESKARKLIISQCLLSEVEASRIIFNTEALGEILAH
jgi:hypothetical protein